MTVISVTFRPAKPRPASLARRAWRGLRHAMTAARTRRHLAGMDDRMLADIGVSRAEAMQEAARPVWDCSLLR